jgi:hypothetical protein
MTAGAEFLQAFVHTELRSYLRQHGLRGRHTSFRRERPESIQFVVIDRLSEGLTATGIEVDFDIKLGSCSRFLLTDEAGRAHPSGQRIRFVDCQVTPPLHALMYKTGGGWWTINEGAGQGALGRLGSELRAGLGQHGLPWLERVATGDGLADAWLEVADSLGETGKQHLLRLLTLLGRAGDVAQLR